MLHRKIASIFRVSIARRAIIGCWIRNCASLMSRFPLQSLSFEDMCGYRRLLANSKLDHCLSEERTHTLSIDWMDSEELPR